MTWRDQKPGHKIIYFHEGALLCSCGERIEAAGDELKLIESRLQDVLLDRFTRHKAKKEAQE